MEATSDMEAPSGNLAKTLVKRPRGSRTGHRILRFCGMMAVALGGFLYWRDLPPEVHVPTPTMPSPNALDYFIRAADMKRDISKVDWATCGVHSGKPLSSYDRPYSAVEKAALIRENAPALLEFRDGLAYPLQQPPVRSITAGLPQYAKLRGLARLLVLEAQVKGAQGNWSGTASTDIDIIRLGAAVPHGGNLIGGLVGVSITAMGQKQLWKDLDHLNATQARDTAWLLNSIDFIPYSQVMQEEEWTDLSRLAEFMAKPNWILSTAEYFGEYPTTSEKILLSLWMQRYGKRQIMGDLSHYMDGLVAEGRLPYAAKHPAQT
ncbi:MAG: hypothetical protein M3Y56_03225, partial [Armatimonadota bacterium]|nr:hypothetical protein [Armatimonadota bacterium]